MSFLHAIQLEYASLLPVNMKLYVTLAAGYSSTFDIMVQPWSYSRSTNGPKERIFPS